MTDAGYILNDFKDLYNYCKQLEEDSYNSSEAAENEGRQRISASMLGESMAYSNIAHKIDTIVTAWKTALKESGQEV